jgi:ribA/ribD-fused uncharacterized protein
MTPNHPIPPGEQLSEAAERQAAEQEYTVSAFDYARDPIGSERWCQFWKGWQARARLATPFDTLAVDALRGLDTVERVRFYEHDFYPLSNFSAFTLQWKGRRFDTSEAAYHWEKFPDAPEVQDMILEAPSAHEAFKLAESQRVFRREDWDAVKLDVMRAILRAKVEQHEYVRRKLLATGDRLLVEDSWRDDFWGWGPNRDGQNWLGRLWMETRALLAGQVGSACEREGPHA